MLIFLLNSMALEFYMGGDLICSDKPLYSNRTTEPNHYSYRNNGSLVLKYYLYSSSVKIVCTYRFLNTLVPGYAKKCFKKKGYTGQYIWKMWFSSATLGGFRVHK